MGIQLSVWERSLVRGVAALIAVTPWWTSNDGRAFQKILGDYSLPIAQEHALDERALLLRVAIKCPELRGVARGPFEEGPWRLLRASRHS